MSRRASAERKRLYALSLLQSAGRVAAFCRKIGIETAKIGDYRLLYRQGYTPLEAAAICRGEMRP